MSKNISKCGKKWNLKYEIMASPFKITCIGVLGIPIISITYFYECQNERKQTPSVARYIWFHFSHYIFYKADCFLGCWHNTGISRTAIFFLFIIFIHTHPYLLTPTTHVKYTRVGLRHSISSHCWSFYSSMIPSVETRWTYHKTPYIFVLLFLLCIGFICCCCFF